MRNYITPNGIFIYGGLVEAWIKEVFRYWAGMMTVILHHILRVQEGENKTIRLVKGKDAYCFIEIRGIKYGEIVSNM